MSTMEIDEVENGFVARYNGSMEVTSRYFKTLATAVNWLVDKWVEEHK